MDGSIGDLFRCYGEQYIKIYQPPLHKIKLIRAIRVCKTPALGGRRIDCKDCGNRHYVYFSCGQSQCPLCQSIKRAQWQDRLGVKLLNVPYVHMVFTLPHELNGMMKSNQRMFYNTLYRMAWKTVKTLSAEEGNIGGLPGMVAVLHTFGSDMKYHVHLHCLVTYGGIRNNEWQWPKRKKKIAGYRAIRGRFKSLFIASIEKQLKKTGWKNNGIDLEEQWRSVKKEIAGKEWNVSNSRPTMNSKQVEEYLGRYVNRVAISKSRLTYLSETKEVQIIYNDYRNQKKGEAAPKKMKPMLPLVAIDQIMQHVLDPYFQKNRYYGLHASSTYKKIKDDLPEKLKRVGRTIRTVFEILHALLGMPAYECERCGSIHYEIKEVRPDKKWKFNYLTLFLIRPPPLLKAFLKTPLHIVLIHMLVFPTPLSIFQTPS